LIFAFILTLSVAMYFLGPQITGFVTFSETKSYSVDADILMTKSGSKSITNTLDDASAFLISGKVMGKGTISVFLINGDKKYLVYHFEGDAGEGIDFRDICYGSCYIPNMNKNLRLYFDIENTAIQINKISYLYDKVIDFRLEPKSTVIDYNLEPAKIVDLTLTNDLSVDYSVLLYVDGALSQYFSYDAAVIKMTPDIPERIIPLTIKLPSNLAKGEYLQKVTARYIPTQGTFVGSTPIEEVYIKVVNQ
jgi:hypothetical protein